MLAIPPHGEQFVDPLVARDADEAGGHRRIDRLDSGRYRPEVRIVHEGLHGGGLREGRQDSREQRGSEDGEEGGTFLRAKTTRSRRGRRFTTVMLYSLPSTSWAASVPMAPARFRTQSEQQKETEADP
jgi:hypothetical protein